MAVLGTLTLNEILIFEVDANPSVVGLNAPSGSVAILTDGTFIFAKGAGDEFDWTAIPVNIKSLLDAETSDRISEDTAINTNVNKIKQIFLDSKEPTGVVDRTQSVISFDNNTRTFSISPVSSSFAIYIQGEKYTINSTLTKQIPNVSGSYFFYIDSNLELNYLNTFSTTLFTSSVYVSYVLWDEVDSQAVTFGEERHGIVLDGATHSYLHTTRGTQLVSGHSIGFTLNGDGSSNSHAQISISDGVISDEDIRVQITNNSSPTLPFQQILSPVAKIPIYYRSNVNWRKLAATDYPLAQGTNRAKYNKNTNGVWSLEEASQDGKILVSYIFATTNINQPIIALLGQDEYTSVADAETRAAWSAISFGDLPAQEIKFLHIVIYETNSSFTNAAKCVIKEVKDLRFGIDREVSATSLNTDHSNLSGLGNDDHLQYHNNERGDIRYYKKDEVDTFITNEENARIAEDSTFLKLDGSRIMTGQLKSISQVTVPQYTTATTNGSLILTNQSYTTQFITETTPTLNYSVVLPNATTLPNGWNVDLYNRTSNSIAIKFNSGATAGSLSKESVSSLILQDNTTTNGIWSPFTVEIAQQAAGVINFTLEQNTAFSTTSATDVQVPTFILTPQSGQYFISLNMTVTCSGNNATNFVTLYKNGVAETGTLRSAVASANNTSFILSTQGIISVNGLDEIRVYVRTVPASGAATTLTVNSRSIVALRLGSA